METLRTSPLRLSVFEFGLMGLLELAVARMPDNTYEQLASVTKLFQMLSFSGKTKFGNCATLVPNVLVPHVLGAVLICFVSFYDDALAALFPGSRRKYSCRSPPNLSVV